MEPHLVVSSMDAAVVSQKWIPNFFLTNLQQPFHTKTSQLVSCYSEWKRQAAKFDGEKEKPDLLTANS